MSVEDFVRAKEIKSFYTDVQRAFAAGNAGALAALFDSGIAKPMTHAEILKWSTKFFQENSEISFHIDKLTIDDMGPGRGVVRLTYHVTTAGGKGDFGGTEIDILEKHGGWWRIISWEKVN